MSAVTQEGTEELMRAMESALSSQMEYISCTISYDHVTLLSTVHNMGILDEVQYVDEGVFVRGKVPLFLKEQIDNRSQYTEEDAMGVDDIMEDSDYLDEHFKDEGEEREDEEFDWSGLAKGRHSARKEWDRAELVGTSDYLFRTTQSGSISVERGEGSVGHREVTLSATSSSSTSDMRIVKASDETSTSNSAKSSPKSRKRKVAITAENKRKAIEADGDEFNDTSKLLDFDAGDYDGSSFLSIDDDII
jgi:hypothetical protein